MAIVALKHMQMMDSSLTFVFHYCRRMFSRKKAAQRAKRMAGQGLEAFPKANLAPTGMTALAAATRDRVDRSR